jgi:hypothetical protein
MEKLIKLQKLKARFGVDDDLMLKIRSVLNFDS